MPILRRLCEESRELLVMNHIRPDVEYAETAKAMDKGHFGKQLRLYDLRIRAWECIVMYHDGKKG
jgi:hypothetical protein